MESHWLLVRGLIREQRHWGGFPAVLERTIPGARVHTLDLAGMGTEHLRETSPDIESATADIRERWLALKAKHAGAWHLVGISLGGMVAQQWSAWHPDDFVDVTLINSSASNLSPPWERMVGRAWPDVLKGIFADVRSREELIFRLTTRLQGDRGPALVDQWVRWFNERPMSTRNGLRQLYAASRWKAPPSLRVPVLVVASENDELVQSICSRRLAKHYGAELRLHPNAGHDLPLDDPSWLAAQLADWTAQRRAAA